MKRVLPSTLILLLAVAGVAPAPAQLTVATNEPAYDIGEIVHITLHNGGPSEAQFVSMPLYSIYYVEGDAWLFGNPGLPVVTSFAVGRTDEYTWDTGVASDAPGHYLVLLNGASGDPGSILQVEYQMRVDLDVEPVTWGGVRSLFR